MSDKVTWDNMHRAPQSEEEMKGYVGFIYRITERDTLKMYIGIKQFWSKSSAVMLKGMTPAEKQTLEDFKKELIEMKAFRTGRSKCRDELRVEKKIVTLKNNWKKRVGSNTGRKRRFKKESNWKTYKTSSELMQNKLEENPENYFCEIINLCTTLTELKAREARIQLNYYLNGEWDRLYNENIQFRLRIR